jgi:hypothetical protein
VGGSPHHPPAEMVAQMLKRAGKWMWRQERVVHVKGCGGVADDVTARVASTGGLKVLFQRSFPMRM